MQRQTFFNNKDVKIKFKKKKRWRRKRKKLAAPVQILDPRDNHMTTQLMRLANHQQHEKRTEDLLHDFDHYILFIVSLFFSLIIIKFLFLYYFNAKKSLF